MSFKSITTKEHKVFTQQQQPNNPEKKIQRKNRLYLSSAALPTCKDLLCGALGAVAGGTFGHHRNIVGQTTVQILYYAVILICCADVDVTFAAHNRGAEL